MRTALIVSSALVAFLVACGDDASSEIEPPPAPALAVASETPTDNGAAVTALATTKTDPTTPAVAPTKPYPTCALDNAWDTFEPGLGAAPLASAMVGDCFYRVEKQIYKSSKAGAPSREDLWLTKGNPKGGHLCQNLGEIVLSSSVIAPGAPSPASAFPLAVVGLGKVVATLTQRHVQGSGLFELVARDGDSGEVVRDAQLPITAAQGKCEDGCSANATAVTTKGPDVIVIGKSQTWVAYKGETGKGEYFEMTFENFLSATCTPNQEVTPSSVVRSTKPF